MNRIFTVLLGTVSCIIAAFLNFYIQDLTSINVFSFSIWFVIPVGAILVGMAANSGYYLSTLMTHRMLDRYDFFTMMGMAIAGLFLIYAIEYYYYIEKAGLRNNVSFWQYIALVVENSTYHVRLTKLPLSTRLGTLGMFGYLFLFIHLVGFIIGGAITFLLLFGADTCAACSKYLRNKRKKMLYFNSLQDFNHYQKKIDELAPSSSTFKSFLFDGINIQQEKEQGAIKYTWRLKKCNSCNAEVLSGHGEIYQGKEWSTLKDAGRKFVMPVDSNLEQEWNTKDNS